MFYQLRPYQVAAISAIRSAFRAGKKRVLIVMATGTGKTVVFTGAAKIAIERGRRVLVLADRSELIDQTANKMADEGLTPCIEKASSRAREFGLLSGTPDPPCVIASVSTMKGDRLQTWPRDYFDMLVIDEAHHATAPSYRRIIEHFRKAYVLGVTATPIRADKVCLGEVFESDDGKPTFTYSLAAGIDDGYLSPLDCFKLETSVDLAEIRTTSRRGDWSTEDLEKLIAPHVEELANTMAAEIRPDDHVIVFTPDVGSAEAMSSALAKVTGMACDHISGLDDPDVRRAKTAAFKAGQTRIMANCNLYTEGFDCPSVNVVAICRPTKSESLYAQMVGRGTRLCDGKDRLRVLDFLWKSDFDLAGPIHLFAEPNLDSEIMAEAKEIVDSGKTCDPREAIEKAKEHVERRRFEVEAKKRKVQYRRTKFTPFGTSRDVRQVYGRDTEAATPKQLETLHNFGVDANESWSKRRASNALDLLFRNMKEGKATYKQAMVLSRRGDVPFDVAMNLSKSEASEMIEALYAGSNHR